MDIQCTCCNRYIKAPINTLFSRLYAQYDIFWCDAICAKNIINFLDKNNINFKLR